MKSSSIAGWLARLFLLLGCTCCLSSCSAVGSVFGLLVSIPVTLLKVIVP